MVQSPTGALALAACFVVISQLKINITNAYAGSIGWSNFFSRLTHSHPGRVVWLVFNIAIALLLMELGIYQAIEHTLVLYSAVAAAWVGALVADLVVNKPLGFSPAHIEFKRAHLYDINPVGCRRDAARRSAAAARLWRRGRRGGGGLRPLRRLRRRLPRRAADRLGDRRPLLPRPQAAGALGAAEHDRAARSARTPFEPEDMAFCPAYAGPICSLCCSLDARCHDACKPHARFSQTDPALDRGLVLPPAMRTRLAGPLGRWAGMVSAVRRPDRRSSWSVSTATWRRRCRGPAALAAGAVDHVPDPAAGDRRACLAGHAGPGEPARGAAGVPAASRLLLHEIDAHERTDANLQKAKEAAEAANLAKSRYVVGISHELRSPLNAILGYAQLMEGDPSISAHRREHIKIIRHSGDHMAGLIEGLLDISKIEAGRIEIYRDQVRLGEFLQQLADMFRIQAEARGIGFVFASPGRMPGVVFTDERRLRQILINLLSNAVKFTHDRRSPVLAPLAQRRRRVRGGR